MVDGDAKNDPTYGTASLFPSGLGYPDKVSREMRLIEIQKCSGADPEVSF